MRTWIFAACLATVSAAHAQVELQEGVGPFQFGMSREAARDFGTHSNSDGALVARDPIQLAGLRFDATVEFSQFDLLSEINLKHESRSDARRCRVLHADIIAALEPRYGPFDHFSYQMPRDARQTSENVAARSSRTIYRTYDIEASNVNSTVHSSSYVLYRAEGGGCSLEVQLGPVRPLIIPPLPAPNAAQLAAARPATGYRWDIRPRLEASYPQRALERQQAGTAQMDCIVQEGGRLACAVVSEDPPGWGFGEGARIALANARVQETAADGSSVVGARIRPIFRFMPPS